MFELENKPVKDWTLTEAKEYCKNKKCDKCYNTNDKELKLYCQLAKQDICCEEPCCYNLKTIPEFTPDEIAYLRLIKKICPWANYIVRTLLFLGYLELQPVFTNNGFLEAGRTGRYTSIDKDFFPQIKPLTYYAIDDIIKQGDDNNA